MGQEQGRSLDEAFDAIIDAWLIERQALLTQFVALPQMSVTEDVIHELHSLCEAMVDYSSRGHFNVYEQLLMHIAEHNNLHAPMPTLCWEKFTIQLTKLLCLMTSMVLLIKCLYRTLVTSVAAYLD